MLPENFPASCSIHMNQLVTWISFQSTQNMQFFFDKTCSKSRVSRAWSFAELKIVWKPFIRKENLERRFWSETWEEIEFKIFFLVR